MNELGSSMLGQHAEFEVEFKKSIIGFFNSVIYAGPGKVGYSFNQLLLKITMFCNNSVYDKLINKVLQAYIHGLNFS